jgi:peptidylprolyl isomerase
MQLSAAVVALAFLFQGGLVKQDIKVGSGPAAKAGDAVIVNYVGTLKNGTKFDSSKDPGRTPFEVILGQHHVIEGWEQGLVGMKAGGTRKLTIPPSMAYGDRDMGVIPPNSTLIFVVDMLKINGKGPSATVAKKPAVKKKHVVSKKRKRVHHK